MGGPRPCRGSVIARSKRVTPIASNVAVKQRIIGYHQDAEHHWVAELECGHDQHVRHDPPWTNRRWVTTPEGRERHLGQTLMCKKCVAGAPRDRPA